MKSFCFFRILFQFFPNSVSLLLFVWRVVQLFAVFSLFSTLAVDSERSSDASTGSHSTSFRQTLLSRISPDTYKLLDSRSALCFGESNEFHSFFYSLTCLRCLGRWQLCLRSVIQVSSRVSNPPRNVFSRRNQMTVSSSCSGASMSCFCYMVSSVFHAHQQEQIP